MATRGVPPDPRVLLVPVEQLGDDGILPACVASLARDGRLSQPEADLFAAGLRRYEARGRSLARATHGWPAPRRRNLVVVDDPDGVRPYAPLLNATAWVLAREDLAPERSHAELVAYLLAHFDWMERVGEVSQPAVLSAAWWLERSDEECEAFCTAARRATRPDAATLGAIADAVPWLRRLGHVRLRPLPGPTRDVPAAGLQIPGPLEAEPPALVARCEAAATQALERFRARWREPAGDEVERLLARLASDPPPLLVVAGRDRTLWDPERPDAGDALRSALARADAVAVRALVDDLDTLADHTRRFLGRLADPALVAADDAELEPGGYAYLVPERSLLAYDLAEPGMERLQGPALPFARDMLGARAAHEWGHAADRAGCVVREGSEADHRDDELAFSDALASTLTSAVRPHRRGAHEAQGYARLVLSRLPDYRANLVASHFMGPAERDAYVRHNARSHRYAIPPSEPWRLLARYLYEVQYLLPGLGLIELPAPFEAYRRLTGMDDDLFARGLLDEQTFAALAGRVERIASRYRIDGRRLRVDGARTGDAP